ncbi:Kef-type K+ transport system, membrane component KefB [Methanococcoides vulcani]|uniref:Kef-type K+ transport system, membrane component KefB n=1 Tax=Methanococcoides vulcani TaxID=1353158 RepID=A0A1I0ASH7_9EURY|nr:cation:proton antiporter [Methanococcoides vulcani]SES97341.1 Kef-type K+ transport system, membrane component KefB [Methanococcoides vulcani]
MEVLFYILLILLLAKVFGELFERVGFPSILGELLSGVVLGTFLIHQESEIITFLAEMGAIFLLFTAGYKEVHLRDLRESSKKASIASISQILVAFSAGFLLGMYFQFSSLESIFMGVAFSPTSIGVVVRTLIDMDYLSSKPGSMMLSSSILDDIIGIFLLSIVVTMATYDQFPSAVQILFILSKIVAFVAIMLIFRVKFFPTLFAYVHKMHVKESIFAFVIMVALFSAYLAEVFGLHAVIGAFIGGVMISDISHAKIEHVQSKVTGVAYGLFVPIFFAFIGLSVNIATLQTVGLFSVAVVLLALAGKLIGGFAGGRLIGFDNYDSLIFGVGVMPRAGVELVLISIGKELGIIGDEIFSAIVLMVAVSIFISPVLLKMAIQSKERTKSINT